MGGAMAFTAFALMLVYLLWVVSPLLLPAGNRLTAEAVLTLRAGIYGTMKAASFSLIFAVPLALMAAIYSACFMAPRVRCVVKPVIEMMAAVPTVVLGLVAVACFAPWLERHLLVVVLMVLLAPAALIGWGWISHRYGDRLNLPVSTSLEWLYALPVVAGIFLVSTWLNEPVQALLFDGDMGQWLITLMGTNAQQRNGLVVGFVLGFATIPVIFSIAEDALHAVPKSLSNGSLALGATPWQTVTKVILPTAGSGLVSAVMIGFGRAVGETMIVLMAVARMPIMDWNPFQGLQTLAAEIALGLGGSEAGGELYRTLVLAALLLFAFTFVTNAVAEVFRERLREKYLAL